MSDLGLCIRTRWGLLGEWWCVAPEATEEDCLTAIMAETISPVSDPALVRDRLYGGFHCQEEPGRRHVYFCTGQYTYLNPEENRPLDEEERRKVWKDLCEANGEPGTGLFTEPWTAERATPPGALRDAEP